MSKNRRREDSEISKEISKKIRNYNEVLGALEHPIFENCCIFVVPDCVHLFCIVLLPH